MFAWLILRYFHDNDDDNGGEESKCFTKNDGPFPSIFVAAAVAGFSADLLLLLTTLLFFVYSNSYTNSSIL
jgi:hypothetical protein